jgi:phosphoenolpyruvate-protein kinase (PTS system EI component)
MSAEHELTGVPASPGLAAGPVRRWTGAWDLDTSRLAQSERPAAVTQAINALASAAGEIAALAARLGGGDAEILETGILMASDPALLAAADRTIRDDGLSAPAAILAATEEQARRLEALDDALLAARAADVRSLGHRAARLATEGGNAPTSRPLEGVIVARDLGPADVAELGTGISAIALAGGGTTGHAAIVARSLGMPMVVGVGARLLEVPDGGEVVVDGDAGSVLTEPTGQHYDAALAASAARHAATQLATAMNALPAITRDGVRVGVLANVSSTIEVESALAAGADGVGLLRTELSFLDRSAWPTVLDHRLFLEPILALLAGRQATVRLLDFGGDKTPPFLSSIDGRGIELLLRHPAALRAQLAAVLAAGQATDLRVLVPMVLEPSQLQAVREAVVESAATAGVGLPLIGAMIEVPGAVALADHIVAEVDFLSIGTNDLTALQLGLDRSQPGIKPAHHPAVLRLVDAVCRSARSAGIAVAVCGEAASDPVAMPLLLGLGVDELSVGSSRVGCVRGWVRALDHGSAVAVAKLALQADSAKDVERLIGPLRSMLLAS